LTSRKTDAVRVLSVPGVPTGPSAPACPNAPACPSAPGTPAGPSAPAGPGTSIRPNAPGTPTAPHRLSMHVPVAALHRSILLSLSKVTQDIVVTIFEANSQRLSYDTSVHPIYQHFQRKVEKDVVKCGKVG
jgi:hypothetical protein